MLNQTVLMSGVDYFDDGKAINPFMNKNVKIDIPKAHAEHLQIQQALKESGVNVRLIPAPEGCQDGVYTSNWALIRGKKAVLSNLPPGRTEEMPYAKKTLQDLGFTTYTVPDELHFSGQADALPCGNILFMGSGYRTQKEAHQFILDTLGYSGISLQTIPKRSLFGFGKPVINQDSGWPDSFFYDIDLALAILRPPIGEQKGLIAWCPQAFIPESRKKLRAFDGVDKIEVSFEETKKGFACNLISTGDSVVMSPHAPKLKSSLESKGFKVVTIAAPELLKGGGYIRCIALTLDNA